MYKYNPSPLYLNHPPEAPASESKNSQLPPRLKNHVVKHAPYSDSDRK